MTRFGIDEVNGIIIGGMYLTHRGGIFYAGRQQGKLFHGENDAHLREQGKAALAAYRAEYGAEFARIYPDASKWELRIWD